MYSQELQKLIDAALIDGVITESERRVIHKRAIAEGVDIDEIDMILDAEVHKQNLSQESASKKIRKCPNCGEVIPSMAVRCEACGYEFQDLKANNIVEKFTEGLSKHKDRVSIWDSTSPKAQFIQSFAVPNNAQDLYELIIYLSSAVKNFSSSDYVKVNEAYIQKLKECTDKVILLYPNDQRFNALLRQTKLSWWGGLTKNTRGLIIGLVFLAAWFILVGILAVIC